MRNRALVRGSEPTRSDPIPLTSYVRMAYDAGLPTSVIRFRMLQARTASVPCPAELRARRPSPMIDLYRKKLFSTPGCRWYPDTFFHCRRPTSRTALIV